jgi:hypothetical protein
LFLKQGEILGPFLREDLLTQIEGKRFRGKAISPKLKGPRIGRRFAFCCTATPPRSWTAARSRRTGGRSPPGRSGVRAISCRPIHCGVVLSFSESALGTLLLSFWPAVLWLPSFAVATYAGILLFRRGAAGNATLLLGCVLVAVAVGLATLRKLPQ